MEDAYIKVKFEGKDEANMPLSSCVRDHIAHAIVYLTELIQKNSSGDQIASIAGAIYNLVESYNNFEGE